MGNQQNKRNTISNYWQYIAFFSDFYIKLKSDSELAIMYHDIEYGSNPSEWIEYDEMLVIPIKKDTEIQINEPVIFRGEIEGEPDAVG